MRRNLAERQPPNVLSALARPLCNVCAIAAVFMFSAICAGGAWASCAAPSPDPQCRAEFELFSSITWSGNAFVAVGHLNGAPASAWAIAVVDQDGRLISRREVSWRRPVGSDDIAAIEFKKVLALPRNSIGLIGVLRLAHSDWMSGLVLVVGPDGRVMWEREQVDPTANVMFQSGTYDPATNRIIAVGRRTVGNDNGTCSYWSQSYVQGFSAANGDLAQPQFLEGAAAKGPNNRQGVYDIGPGEKAGQFVFVGLSTVPKGDGGRCKDQIMAGIISPAVGAATPDSPWRWTVQAPFADDAQADEVGFRVESLGAGHYLIVGQKTSPGADHPDAHALRIKLAPLMVEGILNPKIDPSNDGNPSRFRVAVPIDPSHFLLAGSMSHGPQILPRAAMKQIVANDLKTNDDLAISDGAADILDAASSPSGRVIVVGFGLNEKGGRAGWLDALASGTAPAAEPAAQRSLPDATAIDLDTVKIVDGAYQIALGRSTTQYLKRSYADNAQLDLALNVSIPLVLRAGVLPGKGEVEVALTDDSGRLVDFSNYRGSAQLLITKLEPGHYKLSVFTQKAVRDIRIELGTANEVTVASLSKMMSALMDKRLRQQLADQLLAAGFSEPPDPPIAFGGETAISVLAAQSATNRPFGPNNVGRLVAQSVEEH